MNFNSDGFRRDDKGVARMSAMLVIAIVFVVLQAGAMAGQADTDSPISPRPANSELQLLGTVVREEPAVALAIIQLGSNGEQQLYRLGDVVDGGRLTSIRRDGVTLAYADVEVAIDLDGRATETAIASATAAPAASDWTDRVQPPLDKSEDGYWLLDQATIEQLEGGELDAQLSSLGANGMRVTQVRADGPLQKLGLQQGDVIQSVNGQVPGVDASLQQAVARPISDEPVLQLMVDRRGNMDLLYYKIDP